MILPSTNLDIFNFRDEIIAEYRSYIESFLKIRDSRVKDFVQQELNKGQLWTPPLVQINPAYQRSATINHLINQKVFHPDCQKYFPDFNFYRHQEQAFNCAKKDESYVLTTGTGSGKSLTYVVPIINDLLEHPEIKGVRAILVYPMNALINSQTEEFKKFLSDVSHIKVAQYTGQESLSRKSEIQENPPHILLTNYVMLELMLTRVYEDKLVTSPNLKFLVLDELHTYRGRQGADVAVVIRKLRQRCGKKLLCIGTSATMSTEGSRENRRLTVAGVASKLFGVEVKVENVIDETLEKAITRPYPDTTELKNSLTSGLPPVEQRTESTFKQHPLSAWIEMNFGIEEKEGHLVRRSPITLERGAKLLSDETAFPVTACVDILKQMFLWGSKTRGLAFRLHQFISQGGSVYATIESRDQRFLTLEGQYQKDNKLLYPLVFCRECGQDYYAVRYDSNGATVTPLLPTAVDTDLDEDTQEGYLTMDEAGLWGTADQDRLPDNWFRVTKRKGRVAKKEFDKFIPIKLFVLPNGKVNLSEVSQDKDSTPISCWFIPKPFLTCLNCGIVYERRKTEYSKLSRLSTEGRSTATTLLCLSTVSKLKANQIIDQKAAKILSFTDNRQDASLQAGHFNDFIQTSFFRSGLNRALQTNGKLNHNILASEVVKCLGLSQTDYARQVAEFGSGKKRNEKAFEKLVEYRLYADLRRGWRIVQPNLEQTGLLTIEYDGLEEVCHEKRLWQKYPHPILLQATPQQRYDVIKTVLDQLRKDLVIDAQFLQAEEFRNFQREIEQQLNEKWGIDSDEVLYEANWATIAKNDKQGRAKFKLTYRSKIGQFLRSHRAWPWLNETISSEPDYDSLIKALINILANSGYLYKDDNEVQLIVESMIWKADKFETIPPDILKTKRLQGSEEVNIPVNEFFQQFYQRDVQNIKTMEGREHTGQVNNQNRKDREAKFREGALSALFCSPTMELGIDIADLSVVHLRNVPPSPANYAQRSGRAGRSGQQALVITYAAAGSGHDQYFYQRQQQMVAGEVTPPKLELANPDLIKSHIYSIWLAHTGIDLGDSMNQILDLDIEGYPLKEDLKAQLKLTSDGLKKCLKAVQTILEDEFCQRDLKNTKWYSYEWLSSILKHAIIEFNKAGDRWRKLYKDAVRQRDEARRIIDRSNRGNVSTEDRINAETSEKEAKRQIDLLIGQSMSNKRSSSEFEFYPYRYFAAEGFLPGFNFPRLPVRAYIPDSNGGEFIARPRVVAIRELAPTNIVYYEGNKFQINKTKIPVNGIDYKRVKLCFNCGYFHEGEDFNRDLCSNCGAKFKSDSYGNLPTLTKVLQMETALTRRRERITSDEEERLKYGYNITTHFRYAEQRQESAEVVSNDGQKLLKLTLGETADIWRINRGLKRGKERGFKLDTATGFWGDSKSETENLDKLDTEVHLLVQETCNILVIQPEKDILLQENSEAFLTTLQYALERAIQADYKLEENELASEKLGEGKYLLFWEAAEGGAGVLSQIIENPESFQHLAKTALDICHFKQPKESCSVACYECLLSYRNQFDHHLLNRHLIKPFLEKLTNSNIMRHSQGKSRDEHYQQLLEKTDSSSEFERIVLKEIYQRGIKLPNDAQVLIPEANCQPDFVYQKEKIAVFCDGSVHDTPEQQEKDRINDENLEFTAGYHVCRLRYDLDLTAQLDELASWV